MNYMAENNLPLWQQFSIGIRRIAAGNHAERNFHDHHFSEIVLIRQSDGTVHWAEGKSCILQRGDILLLHPGRVHGYQNCASLELINLLYKADRLPLPFLDGADMALFPYLISARLAESLPPEEPVLSLDEEAIGNMEKYISELERELNGNLPGRNLRVFIIFMEILTLLGRAGKTERKKENLNQASAALSYLNMHFREPVAIDHLAKISNLSRRSLFRHFRELTGMTPAAYCRRKQLEYAADLLRSSRMPLAVIADECGLYDSNYLIKCFTAVFGCSPGKFRQEHENRNDTSSGKELIPDRLCGN